ncbi:uncharacterized protein LOC128500649 isoform X2 [Spea bombifrons]|uniref:uncharacterized protein LOC128500649 isoform X2 n=1 Tax=Spea bombifrons TaxID=233779 RepID=UPI00234BFD94|nr:uncharacterized protein LOC128500649 isoform X2 [Spea bombifrons]
MRPEGSATQPSPSGSQVSGTLQMQSTKNMQNNSLPKSPKENVEAEDSQQFLQPGTKAKDERTGERPHKSRKLIITEKSNNKDHKNQDQPHLQREQIQTERSRLTKRKSDCERPHSTKELIMEANSSGDQRHSSPGEKKNLQNTTAYRQGQHGNSTSNGIEICQSIHPENSMKSKNVVQETKDDRPKADVDPRGPQQPATRKGDMLSGMRKIFSSFGLTSRPRLDRFQSSSLEQISHAASRDVCIDGDSESGTGVVKPMGMKKSPSLQSLKLMSPFHLPRKASSVQNLLGKSDRSAVYVTRDDNTAPRRTLSVEDIGSPAMARVVGRVAEIYPDGTRLLELQRPPRGSFGFTISSGNGRPDSGIYVQEMIDADTAKLYSGLLRVGDEILELNGTKVSTIGPEQLNNIMTQEPTLNLRVLHQRRTKC